MAKPRGYGDMGSTVCTVYALNREFTNFFVSNGSLNPTALPKPCPQSDLNPSQYSEDCLSMMLYVPSAVPLNTKLPVFLW